MRKYNLFLKNRARSRKINDFYLTLRRYYEMLWTNERK